MDNVLHTTDSTVQQYIPPPAQHILTAIGRDTMTTGKRAAQHILTAIARDPWLIESSALEQILAIAQRLNDAPEAVATQLGRPLDNTRTVQMHGSVAEIPVTGPIFRYANLFTEISGATSLEVLARDFHTAANNPAVSRIVLNMNSPGGQSTGIAEFAGLIRASTKPVAAYVGDLAASACYWLAAACDQIIVSPTALLGSIGVVMSYRPSSTRDGEKPPIEIVSSQSPLKRADPETEKGRLEAQRVVDQLAAVFIADVAAYRGVSQETVLADFGRGGILVGAHAVAAGMADRIGTLQSVLIGAPVAITPRGTHTMTTPAADAPTIDRAYLATHHSDLLAALLTEGEATGRAAEQARAAAVRAQHIPGHDALIERLAADGKTTGPEAAMAVLAAEKTLRQAAQTALAASPKPVPTALLPEPATADTYETKVEALETQGYSKAKAMMTVAREHPALHRAWLARINGRVA